MSFFQGEKRKNDQPAPRRWLWALALIGVGIIIGVLGSSILAGRATSSGSESSISDEALYATATWIVEQATRTADGSARADVSASTPAPPSGDPLQITATTIIQRATQTAQALTEQPGS